MFTNLLNSVIVFSADIYRNIATVTPSEHLFDDLSPDPNAWQAATDLVDCSKEDETQSLIISRPFRYAVSVEGGKSGRTATRFSAGDKYGVLYGSLDLETTVHETLYHWLKMRKDSAVSSGPLPLVAQRRVYLIAVEGMLVDLRGKEAQFPELLHPTSYRFTHQVGEYLHAQRQNGLLVKSARCDGINAAILNPDILSNVRHLKYLEYTYHEASETVSVAGGASGPQLYGSPAPKIS